jgi:acetate kinase
LDQEANGQGKLVISSGKSRIRLLVIPTDEELMIARHTLDAITTKSGE